MKTSRLWHRREDLIGKDAQVSREPASRYAGKCEEAFAAWCQWTSWCGLARAQPGDLKTEFCVDFLSEVGSWEAVRGVAVDYLASHGVRRRLRKGLSRFILIRRSCQYFNCFKQDQIHVDTWGQGQGVATGGGLERYDSQLMNICSWLGWNALIYETKLNTKIQLQNSWHLPSCLGPPPPTLRCKVSVIFYPTFIRPKPYHSLHMT